MRYEFGHKDESGFHRNRWGSLEQVKKWALEAGNTSVFSSVFGYTEPK